jgi:hypothetical protein
MGFGGQLAQAYRSARPGAPDRIPYFLSEPELDAGLTV